MRRVRPWLTIAIAALAFAATSCGQVRRTGNVSLRVTVLGGVPVSRVDYSVTSMTLGLLTGSIQTARPATSFERLVSHVPAGKGYQIAVKALSRDGMFTCEGMATFDVKANATTQVNIGMGCHEGGGDGGGKVVITVGIVCPGFEIVSWTISPLVATVGDTIAVSAMATPLTTGASATYHWTADHGAFANPDAASTVFTCAAPGKLTLAVTASNGVCRSTVQTPVTCIADGGLGDDDDPDAI